MMNNQTLTDEQTLILQQAPPLIAEQKSIMIEARAGSGKTFILTQLAPSLPPNGLCLAFNKAIADELAGKLPSTLPALTFHALGMRLLRDRYRPKVNTRKLNGIARKLNIKNPYPYTSLVDAAKIAGLGLKGLPPLTDSALLSLIDINHIDIPTDTSEEAFLEKTTTLFKRSLKAFQEIDFSDMLYLPLHLADLNNWKFDQYPYLLIDEAQDVSPLRLEMINRLTPTIVAVGDPYQAIYAFAGAAGNAFDLFTKLYRPTLFTLSVSFRCPKTITSHATSLIAPDQILSLPNAPQGRLETTTLAPEWFPTSPEQAVLCRMNQPLFVLALRMLRASQPLNFNSKFPSQLISFMKRFKATTCLELTTRTSAYLEEQTQLYADGKIRKGAYLFACEKHDTLLYLASQCEDANNVELTLKSLLYPSDNAPTLSTIHKAKGLEWDDVYILRPDLLPSPFANTDTEKEQETHLEYVAVTRSRQFITYLYTPKPAKRRG